MGGTLLRICTRRSAPSSTMPGNGARDSRWNNASRNQWTAAWRDNLHHRRPTMRCGGFTNGTIPTVGEKSAIEWTDATWNPVTGCTKVSPGCKHCYAQTFSERFRGVPGHPFEQGFDLWLWPDRLDLPLSWRTPKRIFVNSMSDLFHERVPESFIDFVFATMLRAHWHQFQVLTK